jgi:hypothetical protein
VSILDLLSQSVALDLNLTAEIVLN